MDNLTTLTAISPVDGRYWSRTKGVATYFSELAIIKYRIRVEIEYLISLSEKARVVRRLKSSEKKNLRELVNKFSLDDALKIKDIEKTTNHDLKAVEYFLKEKISRTSLSDLQEIGRAHV